MNKYVQARIESKNRENALREEALKRFERETSALVVGVFVWTVSVTFLLMVVWFGGHYGY